MDKIKANGWLHINAFSKGKKVWEISGKNMIVNGGYGAIIEALGGGTGFNIDKAQIGTNGTAAAASDTAITGPIDLTTTHTILDGKIVFNFTLSESVGNGTTFAEFGLITEGGILFARKAVTPFPKIADLSLNCTWTINIQ